MPYIPGQLSKQNNLKTTGVYTPGSLSKKRITAPSISTTEGLASYAESKGLEVKEKKPGLFQRTIDFISRPLYASAGAAKAIVKNIDKNTSNDENIMLEAWKGLTGKEKETYSDVLKETGVKNKLLRGSIGFALDVALDPTTWFGGAIIKGVGKTLGVASKVGLGVGRKFSPRSVASLEVAGSSLKDAFGYAFKYGYKTTTGVSDDVAKYFNKLGIAKEEIVEKNFKILNKFDNKTLREASDIMLKNKRIEFGIREGKPGTFIKGTGKITEAMDEMKKIAKSIGVKTGIPEETLYQNYFPSIKNQAKRLSQDIPGGIKVGQEGYLKKFADKLKDEDLIKKPIEAYSRREFEVVRNLMTKDTLNDMVTGYGKSVKEFDKLDDAAKALWKPIYEKGYKPIGTYPVVTATGKTVRALGKGKNPIGYLKEDDFKFINNYLFPEMKTIDLLAKASGYDKFTNTFKSAVTAWFPAFHVRNYISGNVQNYSTLGAEALNPKNHINALGFLKGTSRQINFKNWKGTGKEMQKILTEEFGSASRYISDYANYIEEIGAKGFKVKSTIQKLNPRQVGNFIETNQKAVAVSTALRQGKTLKEAIKLAERAGFDYTKITQFESKIMRRAIPFYTFARKNAELQIRTAVKNPARILNQIKFTRNLSEVFGGSKPTEEDLKGLPPWALNSLGFKIEGNRFLTKFGLPLEEFIERIDEPGKTTLSSMNPLIKYPLESKLGYDFFRERDIIDISKISPISGEIILDKAPDWFKDIMRVKKVETDYGTKYYASPKALHLLRNIPTARFQGTLEKMFENDKESVDKWLAFITGARIYDIDIEQQKYFEERDFRRDVEDQLLQIGEIKKFETTYVPKD